MIYEYYYNNVPGDGLCRNNLIYTSLISKNKKVFVQWYHNDTEYHQGKNQVINPELMDERWQREVSFLSSMAINHTELVPEILDIDYKEKKIYLKIDGVDFWQKSLDSLCNFDEILPSWQDQMINIIKVHRNMGWHKYSMHPSSYFIVDNTLKSINYFFTYLKTEPEISIKDVESHISFGRQTEMKKYISSLGIEWDQPQNFSLLEDLCWESFRKNYPTEFIEKIKCIK